ncbi:hypothetical protein B1R27_20200 [Streptomyces sp. GKU 895]|nr:hypothetical protein B1R27_20200 [Streptomyces sp. GKU 895]
MVRVDGEAIATASRADVTRMGGSSETSSAQEAAASTPTLVISHAGADRAWAEWVGRHLEGAGYRVRLDLWDPGTHEDLVERMNTLFRGGHGVLALFSPAYFRWRQWTDAEAAGVSGEGSRFAAVMVEESLGLPEALRRLVGDSLHDLDERAAVSAVLTAVAGFVNRGSPSPPPPSPPAFPDSTPRVWRTYGHATPTSPDARRCFARFARSLPTGLGGGCTRCTASSVSARPRSRWSTCTDSPASTRSSGGSTHNSIACRCSSRSWPTG